MEVHGVPLLGRVAPSLLRAVPARPGDGSRRQLEELPVAVVAADLDDDGSVHLLGEIPTQLGRVDRGRYLADPTVEGAGDVAAPGEYESIDRVRARVDRQLDRIVVFEQVTAGGGRRWGGERRRKPAVASEQAEEN